MGCEWGWCGCVFDFHCCFLWDYINISNLFFINKFLTHFGFLCATKQKTIIKDRDVPRCDAVLNSVLQYVRFMLIMVYYNRGGEAQYIVINTYTIAINSLKHKKPTLIY